MQIAKRLVENDAQREDIRARGDGRARPLLRTRIANRQQRQSSRLKKTTTSKKTPARKAGAAPGKSARSTVRRKTAKAPVEQPTPAAVKVTKKEAVLTLLQREEGATLAELMYATGWQAHSVRGFISGTLRKKLGLGVTSAGNAAGEHAYRISPTPQG